MKIHTENTKKQSPNNKEIGQKIEQTNDIIVIKQRGEDGKLSKCSLPSCKVAFAENDTLFLDKEYSEICELYYMLKLLV